MGIHELKAAVEEVAWAFLGGNCKEIMCTHPVPNNLPQPPIGLEVTLERDGFPHNDWRQRLDGNCQISCKKVTKVHTGL